MTEKKTIIDDLVVNYTQKGVGKNIILLHGWQDNLHTFDKLCANLDSNYQLTCLDLPGFGKSSPPPANWTLNQYIKLIKNFLAKLNIQQPLAFVGHSFAGRILIKGLATKKLSSQKLILIASAGTSNLSPWQRLASTILAKLGKIFLYFPPMLFYKEKIRQKIYHYLGSEYLEAGSMQTIFTNTIRENLSPYLPLINQPTLIIWGKNDQATPLNNGIKMSQRLKNAKIIIFKNDGHFVHQSQAEKVATHIDKFVNY